MSELRRFAAAALFLSCLIFPVRARAESMRLHVNWGALVPTTQTWLRSQTHNKDHASPIASLRRVVDDESAVFGTNPRVALILRDWEGGHRLAGGYLSVTDAIRMSRSSRMLMGRVSLTSGFIMPFVQFGAGQWRVDKDMQPYLPGDVSIAAMLGGGFEIGIAHKLALAVETDWTVLYRETREASNIDAAHIFAAFGAVRLEL